MRIQFEQVAHNHRCVAIVSFLSAPEGQDYRHFFIGGCGRIIADFLRELLQIPKFQFIYLNPWSGSWELEMEMGDGSGSGVGWGERLDYRCFMDCAGELVQQSAVT